MLDDLFLSELSNLLSSDPIIPPTNAEQVKSWTLASHLIHALDAAHSPGGERAKTIAVRSCTALETALQPLLEPGEGLSLSSDDLPSPQSVRSMAALAAQAALWASDDGAIPATVMETLLQCAEQCTALGAELQPEKPAGQYSLQLALATARNLKALMGRFPCGSHIIVEDAAARMHVLCMASARLAEQEWSVSSSSSSATSTSLVDRKGGDCARKVAELWTWDLDHPVDENGALPEACPARSLTKVWTEAAAVLLGAAWCTQPSEVRSAFIPLATASSEKEGVLLLLGRLLAIVGGEESASRLLIPVVMDTLAAKSGELDAGVYGVAAHVLASMASACAASDNSWGYTQVVDLLIKLYKFPQFSISAALLHGTAAPSMARQGYVVATNGDSTAAAAAASTIAPGQDIRIYGRCPGALAAALTKLASGLRKVTLKYRKDLRKRLLALFSDFSLIMPNETFVKDLGALLPAAAAAVQGLQDYKHESKRSSMALSSSELSLDALSSMQAEGRALNAALRHLWLHSSVYDFASLNKAGNTRFTAAARAAWPSEWADALCLIAASTPALLLGSEQQKEEAFLEDAVAEYGSWLNKLSSKADASKLMAQIVAVLGTPPPGGVSLPPPLAAHVLTIAYKAVCEATYQYTGHPAGFSPLESVCTHMQYSLVTNADYPWLKQTLVAAFSAQTKRLATLSTAGGADAEYAARAVETSAEVLTANLKTMGPNEDVARTAYTLVESLTDLFPSLLFSNSVFAAALHAVAEQEGLADSFKPQYEQIPPSGPLHGSTPTSYGTSTGALSSSSSPSLPRARMVDLVRQAAAIAPGPAEALVLEMIRVLGAKGGRHASIAMQFTAEVMQALHAGRSQCSLPDLTGSFKGLVAWSVKLHALGTVSGLTAAEEDGAKMIGGGVVARCARALLSAVQENAPDKILISKIIDGAAAIVRDELDSAVPPLLRLLAWTPLSKFVPEVMAASCMVWHWLLAVGNPQLKQTLLEEIAAAWIASKEQRLGLFDVEDDTDTSNNTENGVNQTQEQQQQQKESKKADVAAKLAGIRAHHAWSVFFSEIWRSQHYDSIGSSLSLYTTLGRMLDASLGGIDDSPISQHPSSIGARFRFLQLALSFVCAGGRDSTSLHDSSTHVDHDHSSSGTYTSGKSGYNRVVLYKRIINSALAAFNDVKVRWYEGERSSLREATNSINDFSVLLRQAPSLVAATARSDAMAPRLRAEMESSATDLLKFLLPMEAERLSLWADPVPNRTALSTNSTTNTGNSKNSRPSGGAPVAGRSFGRGSGYTASNAEWARYIKSAWEVSHKLALALGSRFTGIPTVNEQLQVLVNANADIPAVQNLSQAVQYLATPAATAANSSSLQYLKSWAPVNLQQAMTIISSAAGRHPIVTEYIMRSLDICDPEQVSFFLPQLVQLLRNDPEGALETFLLQTASESVYFAYLLVCQLNSEGTPPEEAFNPAVKRSNWSPPVDTGLWSIADRVKLRLWETLHGPVREQLDAQLKFFSDVTDISGKLYPIPKEERKSAAVKFVREVTVPRDDLFMPTDLHARVVSAIPESAAPMQSAAKCPILVAFNVEVEQTDGSFPVPAVEAAIFKVGDDCRQDVLALQVIELLKLEFDDAALPLPLVPYGVIPTGHECGVIEVVPHAKSRAQLGELTDGGLFEVFQHEFGLPGSARFEAARSALIASSAAYAVASYLIQAKDRHNGNIMIDNHGRIIHIDFGYILGISPGGNMGFESAAFKLSYEMTELLDPGNTRTSPHWLKFQELCIKGYLAARSSADAIVATVAMAESSQLPCFSRGATVDSLRQRFHLEMSDSQAAEFMRGLINDAYDKWTTGVYDLIQYYQNKIAF
jgi:phosphatidylinositol 4-kinase